MLPVIWRQEGQEALREVISFIAEESPAAAKHLRDRMEVALTPLSEHPYMYRIGRVPGTREIIVTPNYMIVYRIEVDRIDIVNVVHTRQKYP